MGSWGGGSNPTSPPARWSEAEYNLRIFWNPQKRGSGGLKSPWSPGAKPVESMGNKVPQKLTTFLGLKAYFYAKYVNNFIF